MSGKNIFYLSAEDFYLQPIYSCIHCRANLARHVDLISKSFQGSQGRAYLFNNVVNVGSMVAEERMLLTGLHYVADIYCECCSFILGWKYERAFEPNQRYKEGKYIIELANLIKDNGWDIDFPSKRPRYLKENRKSFSIDWEQSCDSISKNSLSKPCISKAANSLIKELSRDFQYLLGFYDKSNIKINQGILTHVDVIEFTEDISTSMTSTSVDGHGSRDLLRVYSDSDNQDFLGSSLTHSIITHHNDLTSKTSQDVLNLSATESAENSSLNTSYSSSKGLLGASCSSELKLTDVRVPKSMKPKTKKCTLDSSSTSYLPSFETSLSAVTGTSDRDHVTNHHHQHQLQAQQQQQHQHRRHSRHKYKGKHSSNVVNPQRTSTNHRRHRPNVHSDLVSRTNMRPLDQEPQK